MKLYSFLRVLGILALFCLPISVSAATLLSNMGQANTSTNIFRSNIWYAYKITAGSGGEVGSVILNLNQAASNYTGFQTYRSGVISFRNDNNGTVGTAISGSLAYTSTNTGTGYTVYANKMNGNITIPAAGDYWIVFGCVNCANIDFRTTTATGYTGLADWNTVLSSAALSSSGNAGSSWGTPFSTITFGTALFSIEGTSTADSLAPVVALAAPQGGETVSGTSTSIAATATDETLMGGVSFYVDGVQIGSEDTVAPYAVVWDTTLGISGLKNIVAVARDAAGNVATSSSVTVTVDNAVVLNNEAATTTVSSAGVSWNTGVRGYSRLYFGIGTSTATSTAESALGNSPVFSLANLPRCSVYKYLAVTRNIGGDIATSTEKSFQTACTGNAVISSNTEGSVVAAAGGTLTHGGATIAVPAGFTSTSSVVVFQVSTLDANSVEQSVGTPNNKSRVGNIYHLNSIYSDTETLNQFTAPVEVTFSYSGITGIDETSLFISRYDGSSWHNLGGVVNTTNKTITATTTAFSDFGIFGSESVLATSESGSSFSGGISREGRIKNLVDSGNIEVAKTILQEILATLTAQLKTVLAATEDEPSGRVLGASASSITESTTFTRDLWLKDIGADVTALQSLLIENGHSIRSGATGYFGEQTREALAEYQKTNNISPSAGYFGQKTRAQIR